MQAVSKILLKRVITTKTPAARCLNLIMKHNQLLSTYQLRYFSTPDTNKVGININTGE